MSISSWLSWTFSRIHARRGQRRNSVSRPRKARLFLEHLEDRALLSGYSASTVSDLIADINAANAAGGANTISLTAPTTSPYVLTAVDNTTDGPTGLPVIAANDNLTMVGNGDTIERSLSAPAFRLLEVLSGASLTLQNLTLQGGQAIGTSRVVGWYANQPVPDLTGATEGGGIFSQGTLVLNGVTVRGNTAGGGRTYAGNGIDAAGGGIFSIGGSLTLEGGTIVQNNGAYGGTTLSAWEYGGNAYGGGLYASGGTVTVTSATLDNNIAQAGYGIASGYYPGGTSGGAGYAYGGGLYASDASGGTVNLTNDQVDGNSATNPWTGEGGGAYGGGLYLAEATATLTNCTVQGNSALGGPGPGAGGGLFIYYGGVSLDAATVKLVKGNTASSSPKFDDIVGPYTKT